MSGISEERIKDIYDSFQDPGRSLEEILDSKGPLRGAEAQKLRGHFAGYQLNPAHCDNFELVAALMTGRKAKLSELFEKVVRENGGDRRKAVLVWNNYRDSPNKLPLFDLLQVGAFSELVRDGSMRERYYDTLEYLISLGLSVEGEDVAGYTALQHSLTCVSLVTDFRWSQILLDASQDPIPALNHRNRYGATCVHEQMMSFNRPGEDEIRLGALKWAMARGANVDIPDGDGSTARRTAARHPKFIEVMEEYDQVVYVDGGCNFCRRGPTMVKGEVQIEMIGEEPHMAKAPDGQRASLRCTRCKEAFYCSQGCQRMDWLSHKSVCAPPQ